MEGEAEHRGHSLLFFWCFFFPPFCFGNQAFGGSDYALVFTCILPGGGSEVAHGRKAARQSDGKPAGSPPAVGEQANFGGRK